MNTQSKIKELRESRGFSQEELSETSGVSLRTIQRMENGESIPRGSTLRTIASSLNLSSDYFNSIPEEKEPTIEASISTTRKRRSWIPWFIVGFTLIGIFSGLILGFIMMLTKILPENGIGSGIMLCTSALFGSIGIIIGNNRENKNY